MIRVFFYIFLIFSICGCQPSNQQNESNSGKVIAKVGNEELSLEAIQPYMLSGLTARDSIKYAQKLIEQWAIDKLMYGEASEALSKEDQTIEKEVQRYKEDLINHRFEEKLVTENLDTAITKAEIEAYYNEHKESFILKDNIAKVNYVKVLTISNAIEKIKKLLQSTQPKDKEQLKSLCLQQADNYFLNDSTWLLLDDIKKEIPKLSNEADLNYAAGKTIEYTDNGYYYYLKIKEIRIKNSLSPLNFERQSIKKFILNTRRASVIKQYKQQLLEKAKSDKKIVIF